jgi:hypothetical protein
MFGQPQDGDYIEVMPAYGRDYKNQKEVIADLKAGKDFQLTTTRQYINLPQMQEHQFRVIIRYGKLMKVMDATNYIGKR